MQIITKTQADKLILNSLFVPVNGGTLIKKRFDLGKYNNNLVGKNNEIADSMPSVKALFTERRKDKDGVYYALFCLVERAAQ